MHASRPISGEGAHRALGQAILAYVLFCGLSLLSHLVAPLFLLLVSGGVAFPLLWARWSGDWSAVGFTRRNLGRATAYGAGVGAVGAASILLTTGNHPYPPPPLLALQLAIGIPLWLLIMSPFQEFFFRGWLQSRLDSALGRRWGLLLTTFCFVIWHFLAPFQGRPGALLDITSSSSVLTMVGMGLGFGYIFQRTGNIVAPWLAHALMGVALVAVGGMTFVQYS